MNRQECETLIIEKIKEIEDIYKQYNLDGEYLSIACLPDFVFVNNQYYNEEISDFNLPIDIRYGRDEE